MSDKPAATLLHLGPGLVNGLANIHNANRAMSGMVNIVGGPAPSHRQYDAPLASDIAGLARPNSHWVKTSPDARAIAGDGALAIAAARQPPGKIATLILPADTAWNEGSGPANVPPPARPTPPSADAVEEAARVLRSGEPTLMLLTGRAVREDGLALAGKIAEKTGTRLVAQGFNARTQRGRGRVSVERSQTGRSAVPTGAPKIIHFALPWWPLLTQLSRYRCRSRAAALGQFDPFPRLELNGRCRTRKRSFAGDD